MKLKPTQKWIFIAFALLLLFTLRQVYGDFWSNLGWVTYNINTKQEIFSEIPLEFFKTSLSANSKNQEAYLGAGIIYTLTRDEANAYNMWLQGKVQPTLLNQIGIQKQSEGKYDEAFIYFRSSEKLDSTTLGEGYFLAGKLCQENLNNVNSIARVNQSYCDDYFANNHDNLLLNSQFDYPISWGWRGESFFTDESENTRSLDFHLGSPAPSLLLTGLTQENRAGLYQRITLQPNTEVKFSGYFQVEDVENIEVKVLYIEWSVDGRTMGNEQLTITSSKEWTHLERTFLLPNNSEGWIQFYPVLLKGQGKVWIDNVRVEIKSK